MQIPLKKFILGEHIHGVMSFLFLITIFKLFFCPEEKKEK